MSAPVLALLGLRCVGKSTLGAALAERMGARFVDLDEVLATREGQPDAGSLLREVGEPRFREAEREALLEVLALAQAEGPHSATVLATGGGVVEDPTSRALLAGCACLWLDAPIEVLQARLQAAGEESRPALGGGDPVAELPGLARRRAAWYDELAHARLDLAGLGVADALDLLEAAAAPLLP
ncbi:MAG: shikimate kinase [Planctomycetes bacterium]|nr:shikimate kinase [Planctomycetota bacterium]